MAETKEKVIAGETFVVSQPYAEGHVLTAIEAKVLNQVRSENIANNMRKEVKEAIESGNIDAVRGRVSEYDAAYTFATPSTGARRTVDPLEKETRAIARDAIRAQLKSEGRAIKDVEKEKLEAAIEKLSQQKDVVDLAKKRIKERAKVTENSLSDLGL